jgi:hypothetical protein
MSPKCSVSFFCLFILRERGNAEEPIQVVPRECQALKQTLFYKWSDSRPWAVERSPLEPGRRWVAAMPEIRTISC